ncbi:kin of IRRE-like protein 1, partial [Limulus polyphemus]|uniref:Kin of IRRE-like protein 1 n=1 Tax=Limulus polyphemus TaxID=6850 RepID=A0ABM1BTF1_LIMPO
GPSEVKIISEHRFLSAREKTQIICRSVGSRPAANIHWWRDRKRVTSFTTAVRDGNYTISTLTFTPEMEDNGRYLSCEAENPFVPNSGIEYGWILNVLYVPQVTLKLGSNIQLENIFEGKDVYFECHIQANPWIDEIIWLHEGIPIRNKQEEGIIMSNQSLVLQHIRLAWRGEYRCMAYNSQGLGRSNTIDINLKFTPVCSDHRENTYGLAKNESVNIVCNVNANPSEVKFYWSLNNSQEVMNLYSFTFNDTTSILHYKPRNLNNYGLLLCWATNVIGKPKTKPIGLTLTTVISSAGTLVVLAVSVLIFSRCRRQKNLADQKKKSVQKETEEVPEEEVDPNFISKVQLESLSSVNELSVENGNIAESPEVQNNSESQMEIPPTHSSKPTIEEESMNIN